MSAFYDQASLVVVPSGYKSGKIYAQKPLTTDGQLTFTRASTATRVNASGLIESVASGVPRLDYPTLGQSGSCPRLLLEPQRTNSVLYSEQFTNAAWADAGGTVTANTAISPSGYQDADTLTGARYQGGGLSNQYTLSCFAKKVDGDGKFVLRVDVPTLNFAQFNLNNGTIDSVSSGYSATITPFGNGWYRCTLTTPTATAISNFVIISATGGALSTYVWGAQSEIGAYATSYIPTLGTSVTRVADAASKTGISSLIGVNGGSIFLELDANGLTGGGVGNYVFDLSDGTNFDANRISMYWTSANDLSIFYGYGGTFASATYNSNFLTTKKIAVRWTSTQLQVVINGVAQTAVTYGNSSPTKINIASRFNDKELLSSDIKQCLLFNTTLTTAQLQELTTL